MKTFTEKRIVFFSMQEFGMVFVRYVSVCTVQQAHVNHLSLLSSTCAIHLEIDTNSDSPKYRSSYWEELKIQRTALINTVRGSIS